MDRARTILAVALLAVALVLGLSVVRELRSVGRQLDTIHQEIRDVNRNLDEIQAQGKHGAVRLGAAVGS